MRIASGRAGTSSVTVPNSTFLPALQQTSHSVNFSVSMEAATVVLKVPADVPLWDTKSLERLGDLPELLDMCASRGFWTEHSRCPSCPGCGHS